MGWGRLLARAPVSASPRALPQVGRLARVALAGYPHTVLSQLSTRADIVVLSWLTSRPGQVGVYSLAAVGAVVALLAPQALGSALMSSWKDLSGQEALAQQRASLVIGVISTAVTAVAVVAASFAITRLILGSQFAELPLCLLIMTPGIIIYSATFIAYSVFVARHGRSGLPSVATAITLILDMLVLVVLGPRFGALGASVASTISYAVGGFITLWMLRSVTTMRFAVSDFIVGARQGWRMLRSMARLRSQQRARGGLA